MVMGHEAVNRISFESRETDVASGIVTGRKASSAVEGPAST